MHGKTSKLATIVLSTLLYAQGVLGVAAVALVVLKDRADPAAGVVVKTASLDAQLR